MDNNAVLDILRECGSLLEGHFLLTSGKHSGAYCQCARLLQHPVQAETVLRKVAGQVRGLGADVVVGPALGGIVVAYELGRQLGLRAMFAERENEMMTLRRGFALKPGEKVLISEDVVTTGKSTLETIKVVEAMGAQVVGLCCVLDRRTPEVRLPYTLYSAASLDIKTYTAGSCPLCDGGVELMKPGSRKIEVSAM